MSKRAEGFNYYRVSGSLAKSLLWLPVLLAAYVFFGLSAMVVRGVSLGVVDPREIPLPVLIHTPTFATLFFLAAVIGVILSLGLSQLFSILVMRAAAYLQEWLGLALVIAAIPALAIVTWYSYDYLTPSDLELIPGPEFVPYQYGITQKRYLGALSAQAFVSLFSYTRLKLEDEGRGKMKRNLTLVLLVAIAVMAVSRGLRLIGPHAG